MAHLLGRAAGDDVRQHHRQALDDQGVAVHREGEPPLLAAQLHPQVGLAPQKAALLLVGHLAQLRPLAGQLHQPGVLVEFILQASQLLEVPLLFFLQRHDSSLLHSLMAATRRSALHRRSTSSKVLYSPKEARTTPWGMPNASNRGWAQWVPLRTATPCWSNNSATS